MRNHLPVRRARLAQALAVFLVCGCTDTRSDARLDRSAIVVHRVDSGLRLVVFVSRDTIAASDQTAVEVNYLVVNGPKRVMFDNEPGLFSVQIWSSKGQIVSPDSAASPASGSLGETKLVLPARAVLSQVLNLRCIADGAGYGGADPATASDRCLGSYSLRTRDSYRIVVDYRGPDLRWQQAVTTDRRAGSRLDTDNVLQSMLRALHLADTAVLVVR